MKTALHIWMLCCIWMTLPAQPSIHFNRLTKANGLSSDVIYDLHQDSNGFLWIATHGGLDRYDGYRFKHYRYNPGDSNSLSGNYVHCIKEDNKGILWITNNNGLNSLDPKTGIIRRYAPSPATMPKDMGDIMLVNDSVLLVTAIFTAYVFNLKRHSFSEIKIPSDVKWNVLHAKFLKDAEGNICLMSEFIRVDLQYHMLKFLTDKEGVIPPVYKMTYDTRGNVWRFFRGTELLLTKTISGKQVNYPFINKDVHAPENTIYDLFEDGNRMWICTDAGLVYYDYLQNKFYRYRQQKSNAASLSNNRVRCILKDRNGLYWVGTFGSGICHFNPNTVFKNIVVDTGYSDENRQIRGLKALYSGRIMTGTMGGKSLMLRKDKTLHELDYARDFKTPVPLDEIVKEFTGKSIKEFSVTDSFALHVYFGANCIGYPGHREHFVSSAKLKQALGFATILNYHNKVWLDYRFDKLLYDGRNKHWYKPHPNSIFPIANDHFLFATGTGMVEFDANTDSVIRTWLPQPGNSHSIGSTWISCIVPDGKGNYWLATEDAGFDYWDVKEDKFYHHTTKDGLPDNKVYSILPDKQGRLWMSTDNGLSCFDTSAKSFTNYSKNDGLINTEYNAISACIDQDGWFYFGGMNGIDYFHPDSITGQRPVPVLHLASFRIYDKDQPLNNSYKLAANDNNVQLEFTANDFANASKLLFRYKLSGVDENWVSMQGNNSLLYNKLPPGKYGFEVQGSYDGKTWSAPLMINFTIATPWFQSWWFYALLALAAATAIYLLFNYRLQQRLKIYSMRNRISRDLHDDVGATLSSVKAYSKILKDHPDNPLIAELIDEDAGEMIDRLEVIAWATNPNHDSFQSLYNKIQRYAAPLCMAKNISFEFLTDGIAKEMLVPGEIRQNIFLVTKEAVNNSLKYAEPKNISIDTRIHAGKFMLHITDDGNGFDTAQENDRNGLKNMQARMEEIGGSISFTSQQGKGTQIMIQLHYPFRIPKPRNGKAG